MKRALIVMGLLSLAACGADGEPIKPTVNTNVSLSTSGVNVGTNLGVRRGPFNINLGLGL